MKPNVHIIAGPNGVGNTTFAREFLATYAHCRNFVNADLIAEGVSPLLPEAAAFRAGRLMLREIERWSRRRVDFGFETTLSGRAQMNVILDLPKTGYAVHVYFLWVPTVRLALSRIRDRVRRGGHDVPPAVVRLVERKGCEAPARAFAGVLAANLQAQKESTGAVARTCILDPRSARRDQEEVPTLGSKPLNPLRLRFEKSFLDPLRRHGKLQ